MRIHVRKMLALMLFVVVTGAIMTGCGFRYVINSANKLDRDDATEFQVDKAVVEPITRIEIHTGMAEVELIQADNYYVEIDYLYWEEEPEYSLKDGKLLFDDSDALPNSYSINFNLNNRVKIYLPKDSALDTVRIEDASGDVTISGFVAQELDVTVAYGDFTMKEAAAVEADITLSSGSSKISDFQVGDLDFTNAYGNARFTNINFGEPLLSEGTAYEQFNITMSSGDVTIADLNSRYIDISDSYGDITCEEVIAEELELSLSSGNLDVGKAQVKIIDASNSYGDVTLGIAGAADDYSLDLDTSYGKIEVGKDTYEEHLIVDNDGTGKISADLSSGDIRVKFED